MPIRALTLALMLGGPAFAADAPLSAIDWLSRSIEAEDGGAIPAPVSVVPLEPVPVAIGFVSPSSVGLSSEIWGKSDTQDLADTLGRMPQDMPLALRDVLATLVSVRAPADDPREVFIQARIDTLLSLGRVNAAHSLIRDAGTNAPALFRREFDIALLTGHENDVCRDLGMRLDTAPSYPARIFCLARLGDWRAAALTLETADALDVLTADEDILLGRFLDDGEEDYLPPPERPETITPLVFRLYEAIGEPLSTRGLPLAFAHADLRHTNGWKTRIEAAERLYRAGAIERDEILGIYLERAPAASGGVWDRVAVVQAWTHADTDSKLDTRRAAADVLVPAGLGGLVAHDHAPERAEPIDRNASPDPDLAAMIGDQRAGEAALHAILRAASAWDGDPDDLSRALAGLQAVGFGRLPLNDASQWVANR